MDFSFWPCKFIPAGFPGRHVLIAFFSHFSSWEQWDSFPEGFTYSPLYILAGGQCQRACLWPLHCFLMFTSWDEACCNLSSSLLGRRRAMVRIKCGQLLKWRALLDEEEWGRVTACKYSKQRLCSGKIPCSPAGRHAVLGSWGGYLLAVFGLWWGEKNEKSFWPKEEVFKKTPPAANPKPNKHGYCHHSQTPPK